MANTITGISANINHLNNGAIRTMSSRERMFARARSAESIAQAIGARGAT